MDDQPAVPADSQPPPSDSPAPVKKWRTMSTSQLRTEILDRLLKGHSQRSIMAEYGLQRDKLLAIRDTLADETLSNMNRRLMERHLNEIWMKLDKVEQRLWEELPTATKTELPSLAGAIDRITGRRLQILETLDPGPDQSIDVETSLIVVKNREEIRAVMDAQEFLRVTHEQVSTAMVKRAKTKQKSAGDGSDPPETVGVPAVQ